MTPPADAPLTREARAKATQAWDDAWAALWEHRKHDYASPNERHEAGRQHAIDIILAALRATEQETWEAASEALEIPAMAAVPGEAVFTRDVLEAIARNFRHRAERGGSQ